MSRSPQNPSTGETARAAAAADAAAVIAVDTGGTFTDLLLFRPGGGGAGRGASPGSEPVRALKVPSTPHDPSRAILDGVRRLLPGGESFVLLHGSTVATNALLERKGASVALVTNAGFEDVLAIGRQNRPQLYALTGHRPPPLVPRERRLGIRGRLDYQGVEIEALDPDELAQLAERCAGADSVAVVLLHAYANPVHEEAVARALEGLDLPLSVSSRVLPEYREYERTSTTVVNAYVAPVMSRYLTLLAAESGASRVAVMGSSGGTLPVDRAVREPVHTVLSGPAGGVMGALSWAEAMGRPQIITFDMGGTSTDVSLCPGRPLHTREFEIDGQPVAIPVIDIHTVGAGGGSLASVDPGGALRVGPESAGAVPGPIAYGRGGDQVTVTDAHVWLGRLPSEGFLGGDASLDRQAVEGPLAGLASELGLTPAQAAQGVLEVADTAMERALRVISVERGFDPRDFSLVAFGGAGALHAAELARRLGVREALIPPNPGLLSAHGILTAEPSVELTRTVMVHVTSSEPDQRVNGALAQLSAETRDRLCGEHDLQPEEVQLSTWVDARYKGQSFELRVPGEEWVEAFHSAHAARFGYRRDGAAVEAVTVRVTATAPGIAVPTPELAPAEGEPAVATGRTVLGTEEVACTHVWRRDLRPGHRVKGPAVVLDYSATTWVPEGWVVTVHPTGTLCLTAAE